MKPCNFPGRVELRRVEALRRVNRKVNIEARDIESDALRARTAVRGAAGTRTKKNRSALRPGGQ